MNWRLRIFLPMVLVLSSLTATQAQSQYRPPGLSAAALARADNQFGFSLFRTIFASQSKANLVLSPLSASMALQIAYDGARADTSQGMARVLGLSAGQTQVRAAAHALLASMATTGSSNGVLHIANSLWARSGVPFRAPFLQHARLTYNARVGALDFRSPTAPAVINAWVKHATQGKIPTIVDRIPTDLILYLINAVYFQGNWARPFSSATTHAQTFTTSRGATKVQMMSEQGTFPYAKTSNAEAITLPYMGGRFSMIVVLPAAGVSLQTLARTLTPGIWKAWTSATRAAYGAISLPRFSLTTDQQLAAPLARLGMATAFSQNADFAGMCVQPCRLSQARQKTFLNVDEHGTTAAAATSVGVSPTAVQQSTFSMVVDRPFFLSIEDASTGSILFFGAVNTPA
jgi:serine protease inhibitor